MQKRYISLPLKSVSGALLFTVFLGPVGLLYASTLGGIVMLIIGFFVASSKLPIPILLCWIGCSIWGVIAANRYNNKIIRDAIYAKENRTTTIHSPCQPIS